MSAWDAKDRSSVGAESPANTKNINTTESLGHLDANVRDRLHQDAVMFRAGYDDCYYRLMPRIMELECLLRYYVKRSVASMFTEIGFDGAEAARRRSTQRFWQEHGERGAA